MKRKGTYLPNRGDAVWINLDPLAGHEQVGRRPALVLSPAAYNGRVGLALLCPITTRVKGYPFEVALRQGLAVGGVALADQVKSLTWGTRKADKVCTVPEEAVAQVLHRLHTMLTVVA